MALSLAAFANTIRALPLSPAQSAAFDDILKSPAATKELPREVVKRELLTEYQVKMILDGRVSELLIGRYVIVDEVGGGGMGQVFKARDTVMDRVVALKVVRAERLSAPGALARFQQEIRAAARLAHPNIVRAYDAAAAGGKQFLVTEFIEGHDLGRELERRGKLPPGEACEYARQAALGLQHAFTQGLTHRDIKPSNLLFAMPDRVVKVADFGLARFDPVPAGGGLTSDGVVMGTPDYIAPEQANDAAKADVRSDLYSLGCTLYHFLTGHVPFPTAGLLGKLRAHYAEEPKPLAQSCPGLNPGVIAVVTKLMAKNPAARYQKPQEATDALAPYCSKSLPVTIDLPARSSPSLAVPPTPSAPPRGPAPATQAMARPSASTVGNSQSAVPLPVPPAPPAPPPEPLPLDPEPAPQPRSRRALVAGGGVGGLALLAAVLVPLLQKKPEVHVETGPTTVTVNVPPVNVTVKIDDWLKAREPGVVIFIEGGTLSAAEREKPHTAEELKKPLALPPGVYMLVLKKDGKELEAKTFHVATTDADKTVTARVAAIREPVMPPGHLRQWFPPAPVQSLLFSRDGKRFVALSNRVELYDPETDKMVGIMFPEAYHGLVPVLDDHTVLTHLNPGVFQGGSKFGLIRFDNASARVASENVGLVGLTDHITPVWTTSADGTRLMSVHYHNSHARPDRVTVSKFTLDARGTLSCEEVKRFPGMVGCFDPSGDRVLTATGKTLTIYQDKDNLALEPTYTGTAGDITRVVMHTDGKRFAAADTNTAYVWNTGTEKAAAVCKGHTAAILRIAFTTDGRRLITTSADGTVRVWNAETGEEVKLFKHGGVVAALAVSPGGRRIVTGGSDKTIRLWQLPE